MSHRGIVMYVIHAHAYTHVYTHTHTHTHVYNSCHSGNIISIYLEIEAISLIYYIKYGISCYTIYCNLIIYIYTHIYIYIYIVIVILFWWSPFIPFRNSDEVFTYNHMALISFRSLSNVR